MGAIVSTTNDRYMNGSAFFSINQYGRPCLPTKWLCLLHRFFTASYARKITLRSASTKRHCLPCCQRQSHRWIWFLNHKLVPPSVLLRGDIALLCPWNRKWLNFLPDRICAPTPPPPTPLIYGDLVVDISASYAIENVWGLSILFLSRTVSKSKIRICWNTTFGLFLVLYYNVLSPILREITG